MIPSGRSRTFPLRSSAAKWWTSLHFDKLSTSDRWFDRLTTGLSTRLKILTRITEPTEGHAELHGRVAVGDYFSGTLLGIAALVAWYWDNRT